MSMRTKKTSTKNRAQSLFFHLFFSQKRNKTFDTSMVQFWRNSQHDFYVNIIY